MAVVTGAGSGIGRAVALAFAAKGYQLALIGRTRATIEETSALCDGAEPLVLTVDVGDESSVDNAFSRVARAQQRIDVLFNGAGLFGTGAAFDQIASQDWRRVIDTNLTGSFLCARAAFRQMKVQSPAGGRIINCGSISAYAPRPLTAAYTASKHAITGLTRSIALEGRAFSIACGQLDIGNAATGMTDSFTKGTLQADGSLKPEPMMEAGNVADAALFMAELPPEANVLFMTVMATAMPFVGRG
ncbi:SDR family oxidoreductase [Allosphingosinicella sp.]|uniref:SDR family oxidoreductase n=1 Tax=Allosphingosinicella sp. TaxID=2823234 RepID=UPI002FC14D9F